MKILCISDGRAGHESPIKGIIQSVSQQSEVVVEWLYLKARAKFIFRLLAIWSRLFGEIPIHFLTIAYKGMRLINDFDVAISSGRETLPALIALAKNRNKPNVFIGNIKYVDKSNIALNYVLFDTPGSPKSEVATGVPITKYILRGRKERHMLLLCIGGNSSVFNYDKTDLENLLSGCSKISQTTGLTWTITTSRRTPRWAEDYLKEKYTHSKCIETLIIFNDGQSLKFEQLLEDAKIVVCTRDSYAMQAEVINSAIPLISVSPYRVVEDPFFQRAMQIIEKKKGVMLTTIENFDDKYERSVEFIMSAKDQESSDMNAIGYHIIALVDGFSNYGR